MTAIKYVGTVYLLHFDRPYKHARHYVGWAKDLDARLTAHMSGRGSRLLEVVRDAGITWVLARTWQGTRYRERRIKQQGGASRFCPCCGITPQPDKGETITTDMARVYRLRELTNQLFHATTDAERDRIEAEYDAVAATAPSVKPPFDIAKLMNGCPQ